jgi:hypothetical protein
VKASEKKLNYTTITRTDFVVKLTFFSIICSIYLPIVFGPQNVSIAKIVTHWHHPIFTRKKKSLKAPKLNTHEQYFYKIYFIELATSTLKITN